MKKIINVVWIILVIVALFFSNLMITAKVFHVEDDIGQLIGAISITILTIFAYRKIRK